jgi:hypothetical protein
VRSAQNARKHGLNVPVVFDPFWSDRAEAYASVRRRTDPKVRQLGRVLALVQVELTRIHSVRYSLLPQHWTIWKAMGTQSSEGKKPTYAQ